MPNPSPFPSFSFMQKSPPPPSSCLPLRKMHIDFFSNLKILIKKTCLYFYKPTDDLFFKQRNTVYWTYQ